MFSKRPMRVLVLFGTRPEIIKLAPIIRELRSSGFSVTVVSSNQHRQLLKPFLSMLDVEVDFELRVMKENQGPNDVCSRVISKLDRLLAAENPDMILVQGDTTTTLAGAIAGFNRRIPVGHVEAGLRSGNANSPFPEEMNRRIVSQIATFHFAATEANRRNLLSEGAPKEKVFVTGNPVVDSLNTISRTIIPSRKIQKIIDVSEGMKRLLLTTHRRESFGATLKNNLKILRGFVESHNDVCLIFPVHPNPNVQKATKEILEGAPRVHLLEPLSYPDFIGLMKVAWLIVSDSGGVQEEAPSLGKPLLILRENTERPEAINAGVARLVGSENGSLRSMLNECYSTGNWMESVKEVRNPFGDGMAASHIVGVIDKELRIAENAA